MRVAAFVTVCAASLAAAEAPWKFKPARYQGLALGMATREEALAVLGQPDQSGPLEGAPEVTVVDYMEKPPPFPCPTKHISAWFEKEKLIFVHARCEQPLSREALTRLLGAGWRLTTWTTEKCPDDPTANHCVVASPKGEIRYLENRPHGLAYNVATQALEFSTALPGRIPPPPAPKRQRKRTAPVNRR